MKLAVIRKDAEYFTPKIERRWWLFNGNGKTHKEPIGIFIVGEFLTGLFISFLWRILHKNSDGITIIVVIFSKIGKKWNL